MPIDYLEELRAVLIGRPCRVVQASPEWRLEFDADSFICIPWPWRIVADRRVVFASGDNGQWFGLKKPLDGAECANKFIAGRPVRSLSIDEETGDLCINFDGDIRVDAFTLSSGYEGWRAYWTSRSGRWEAIVLGGGELAIAPQLADGS